jgi:two-component system chemotaxis sensor kinase CheA
MWERFLERTAGLAVDDDGMGLDVTDADLELLSDSVRRGEPGDRLLERIEQLRHERVTAALARCADQARGLAERLGKPGVTVMVDAADLRLPAERFSGLFGALVHAVRNAIDHGIELPAARAAAGKAPGGRMELTTRLVGDELIVRIFDDGAGIDWAAIAEKAADRGLPHATHDELVAALFHDGLSTREEVTILSGRGVGMSALLAEARRLGGTITVASERGRGTVMEVRCPLLAMTALRAVS